MLVLLAACSGPGGAPAPERSACDGVQVTAGAGRIAWTVSGPTSRELVDADPTPVGDGFLVGVDGCIAFLELDGHLRWRVPGAMVDAVRVGETIVVALAPADRTVLGLDAATGAIRWEGRHRAIWRDVAAVGETVMIVGTSFDGSVSALSGATGRQIAGAFGSVERPGGFERVLAHGGWLVTSGVAGRRGAIVVADASGTIVVDAPAGLFAPDPVAVVGDVVVLQASGTSTGEGDGEPQTHLVGLELVTGKERWRQALPGQSAGHAVAVDGVAVVRLPDGLAGVDGGSGAVRWTLPLPGTYESPVLAVDGETVAVGAEDGTVKLVTAGDGVVRWSVDAGGPVGRLGAVAEGVLLVVSEPGDYLALSITDGRELWTERGPDPAIGSTPPHHEPVVSVAGGTAMTVTGLYGLVGVRIGP